MLKVCEPPQLFVIVHVPEEGGLEIDNVPETEYWFVAGLHAVGFAVKPETPHKSEQSAEPPPPVWLKVMVPGWLL
jgi:hypothetical protein